MQAIFKSRKATFALIALIAGLVAYAIPETRPYADQIAAFVAIVAGSAIFGITAEDSVRLWAERPRKASEQAALVVGTLVGEGEAVNPTQAAATPSMVSGQGKVG